MPEITRRRTGEILRTLFDMLLTSEDGMRARDAVSATEQRMTLSEYEKGEYPSGGQRFDKILRFATVDLVKAGWLLKENGRWSITPEGRLAFEMLTDPADFYREAVRLYHQWKAGQPGPVSDEDEEAPQETPGKIATVTFEEAQDQARADIETYLATINPYEFQKIVAALLRAMGYYVSWTSPKGKDGGIDIVAANDLLATHGPRIKVQVKRQSGTQVNAEGLRAFMALLNDGDVGMFVSLGGFSRDAENEARKQEKRRVTLVDMNLLMKLWTENYDKLDDEAHRLLPLQRIYFLAPQS